MKKWEELPDHMRCEETRPYYESLSGKRWSLMGKRVFDLMMSIILIVAFSPVMLVLGIAVGATSPGGMIFRQTRVTTYGKRFQIYKFRTMVAGAPEKGSQVTVSGDARVTKIGRFLRKVCGRLCGPLWTMREVFGRSRGNAG